MTVVAGLDIGNSTTEVLLARAQDDRVKVLGTARTMTRGPKGGADSLNGAARLALRVASSVGVRIGLAVVAPLRPVRTECLISERAPRDTGPLRLLTRAAMTASGDGSAVGVLWPSTELAAAPDGPVIAAVLAGTRYTDAAGWVNRARRDGVAVVAVVVESDEAVLVANRLDESMPVIDQTSLSGIPAGRLVAVEARPRGQPLRRLADPYWLADTFGVPVGRGWAQALAAELTDASYGVVADRSDVWDQHAVTGPAPVVGQVRWSDGTCTGLADSITRIQATAPGSVTSVRQREGWLPADDVYAVALADIARAARSRKGSVDTAGVLVAALDGSGRPEAVAGDVLSAALGVPVLLAESESSMGRRGALTTPGCPADALVVDLGGGTVDVSDLGRRVVLAGAGELLTRTVSRALGIPNGLADYAKRGPALRVDNPQLVIDENGSRSFLDDPVVGDSVGALCVDGPRGLLPFNRSLGSGEWRAWRTAAKSEVLGQNVARALTALDVASAASVLVVGGAAGDDEVLAAVLERLPTGSVVGRGEVARSLGHRYAVAYGLAVTGVEHS